MYAAMPEMQEMSGAMKLRGRFLKIKRSPFSNILKPRIVTPNFSAE